MSLVIKAGLQIADWELEESFIQSSGPGGQNVNKVASAVQLRFNVRTSPSLTDEIKVALMRLAGTRLSKEGVLVLTARQFREQERNRADARERLAALVLEAATPQKKRRATRPTLASKKRHADAKTRRGSLKKNRGRPGMD
jgi:ribosome-associated protein